MVVLSVDRFGDGGILLGHCGEHLAGCRQTPAVESSRRIPEPCWFTDLSCENDHSHGQTALLSCGGIGLDEPA